MILFYYTLTRDTDHDLCITNIKKTSIDPNIEKDNKLGKKVKQYDMNNNLLNEYISVSDASRKTSIPKSTILTHLKKSNGREIIWKYA